MNAPRWVAVLILCSMGSFGCDNKRQQQCDAARQGAASAWQAYESAARDRVNALDQESDQAARGANAAAARAEGIADQSAQRLDLSDIVPDLGTSADAGVRPPPTAPHPAGAQADLRRAQLEAARNAALSLVAMLRDTASAARSAASAISSHDLDAMHTAVARAHDAAARAVSTGARISSAVMSDASDAAADPMTQALARVNEGSTAIVQAVRDVAAASDAAQSALENAQTQLARANLALAASGAAFRNAVQARNAARAVPEDPDQPLRAHAHEASETEWQVCNGM